MWTTNLATDKEKVEATSHKLSPVPSPLGNLYSRSCIRNFQRSQNRMLRTTGVHILFGDYQLVDINPEVSYNLSSVPLVSRLIQCRNRCLPLSTMAASARASPACSGGISRECAQLGNRYPRTSSPRIGWIAAGPHNRGELLNTMTTQN